MATGANVANVYVGFGWNRIIKARINEDILSAESIILFSLYLA